MSSAAATLLTFRFTHRTCVIPACSSSSESRAASKLRKQHKHIMRVCASVIHAKCYGKMAQEKHKTRCLKRKRMRTCLGWPCARRQREPSSHNQLKQYVRGRKGLTLQRVSHSGDITLAGSHHVRSKLAAAPVLLPFATVTAAKTKNYICGRPSGKLHSFN